MRIRMFCSALLVAGTMFCVACDRAGPTRDDTQIRRLERDNENLKRSLDQVTQSMLTVQASLNATSQRSREDGAKKARDITRAAERLDTVEEETRKSRVELATTLNRLRASLETMDRKFEEKTVDEGTIGALADAREQIVSLGKKLSEKEVRIAALRQEIETLKEQHAQAKTREATDFSEKLAEKDVRIEAFTAQTAELHTALAKKEQELRDLRAEKSGLWKKLGAAEKENANFARMVRELKVYKFQLETLKKKIGEDAFPENVPQPKVVGEVYVHESYKDAIVIRIPREDEGKVQKGARFYVYRDGERIAEATVFDQWKDPKTDAVSVFAQIISQKAQSPVQSGDVATTQRR